MIELGSDTNAKVSTYRVVSVGGVRAEPADGSRLTA
jgi:hypothetical protein